MAGTIDDGIRFFQSLPEEIDAELIAAMTRVGAILAGQIRREVAAFTSRSRGRKSGALARSWQPSPATKTGQGIEVTVSSDLPYARIHETGGTIRPRRRQWLTVPLQDYPHGTRITDARFQGGFFFRSRRGSLLFGKRRARGGVEPLWSLRKQVTIPAQRYVTKALAGSRDRVRAEVVQAITDAANRASARAGV